MSRASKWCTILGMKSKMGGCSTVSVDRGERLGKCGVEGALDEAGVPGRDDASETLESDLGRRESLGGKSVATILILAVMSPEGGRIWDLLSFTGLSGLYFARRFRGEAATGGDPVHGRVDYHACYYAVEQGCGILNNGGARSGVAVSHALQPSLNM